MLIKSKSFSRVKEVAIQIGIIGFGVALCALAKAENPAFHKSIHDSVMQKQDRVTLVGAVPTPNQDSENLAFNTSGEF